MLNQRVFRLFLSSTFSDFIAEREALQKIVFPDLERYCRDRGASFQAVDLRWGITEEAQRDHDTMRICLEEIRRCQKLSPRPNFAVLLGDRYGWEPVPARIPKDHWKRLKIAANSEDWELIKDSYCLDENAVPAVYCLNKRNENSSLALNHEAKLLNALRRAAHGFRGGARLPYFASATHQEIALGALSNLDDQGHKLKPEQHVHVYVRQIEGLPKDISAKDYIDWDDDLAEIVSGARERLSGLERDLRKKLGDRVHDLHTTWSRHGRSGAINKTYLKRFCEMFLTHQKALIDEELLSLKQSTEIQQRHQTHQEFGAERSRVFVGRKLLLAKIARYVEMRNVISVKDKSKPKRPFAPLILLGGGGSGKSALLARSANEVQKLAKRDGATVVQRYVGGVPGTESLMTMLSALTSDIAILYDQPQPPVPENAKALAEAFQTVIGHATAKRPLIIYIDALDQLDSTNSAWMLEWLPKELPDYVRIVASARTDTRVEQSARRRYPRSLIEVSSMSISEGRAMLGAWLDDKRAAWFNAGTAPSKGRRLTAEQQQVVLGAFEENGSSLWLKLAYEEAATWKSWDKPRRLPTTVHGLIRDLIDNRLIKQENHPKVFTERALAYLTAGRFGLSEGELGRALGTDLAVRAEFKHNEKTQTSWKDEKKLPSVLWSRLYFDLQPYLGSVQIDGALLIRWFHREFSEVLKARYLQTVEDRQLIHGALADSFHDLERELRPDETNDDALFKATDASGKQVSAALRRVMEQPWQLAQAGRQDDLQRLLTDFGFCMGKCAANGSRDLFLDLLLLVPQEKRVDSIDALECFMRTRQHVLLRGDHQWPSHRILLQLATDYGQDNPITRSARQWIAEGKVDWVRLEKVAFLPETTSNGVKWVSSGNPQGHRHFGMESSGLQFEDGHLWSWDTGHLFHWDIATGQALHIETLPTAGRIVPMGRLALIMPLDPNKWGTCALYDPRTGEKIWEKRFASPLRCAYQVGDDAVALIDGVATNIIALNDGAMRFQISHKESQLPRARWRRMAITVLAGRWLIYQYAPRSKPLDKTLVTKSFLVIYDLRQKELVFASDITGIERPLDQYQPFLSEQNPLGLRMAGNMLVLWTGKWSALNPEVPKLGLWDLDVDLREKVPKANQPPDGIMIPNWDDFVPVAWNNDYLVFKYAQLLVAWHIRSGRILHQAIDPKLHRESDAIRWSDGNNLTVIGHSRHSIVDPTQNFHWCLDHDRLEILGVPGMKRPVILAARDDVLVLSRDYRHDTNQGDYAQPEPLIAFNLRTGTSIVFHVMNRVVGYTKMFRHAWLSTGELVVIDGDELVCLQIDQGVPWDEHVETSFGAMLSVSEDWNSDSRFAIIGNSRCMHIDLAGPSPIMQSVAHDFEWGAACELSGEELFIWEDDNEMNEQGNFGRFGVWRRDEQNEWSLDPDIHVEFLCVEAQDFDVMSRYSATRVGGIVLIGQSKVLNCFGVDDSGCFGLLDTLHGSFNATTFWIRGETVYIPESGNDEVILASTFTGGRFGPLTPIPHECMLREEERSYVNVRPFRDMAAGPLRGSSLFMVGQPVDNWTAWDGSFEGQSRDHVCFIGPSGREARWYGLHDCRILRHRISYASLPGRNLFDFFGAEGDVYSLVLDGQIYFVCEEDGSAWLVKLIIPNSSIFEARTS